jgi:hypothetical protein
LQQAGPELLPEFGGKFRQIELEEKLERAPTSSASRPRFPFSQPWRARELAGQEIPVGVFGDRPPGEASMRLSPWLEPSNYLVMLHASSFVCGCLSFRHYNRRISDDVRNGAPIKSLQVRDDVDARGRLLLAVLDPGQCLQHVGRFGWTFGSSLPKKAVPEPRVFQYIPDTQ